MNREHIKYFKIKNFKKFKELEVDDIGLINLVVGDNNVGKTSFLESLLFSEDKIELLKNYHRTLCIRQLHIHPVQKYNSEGKLVDIVLPKINYLYYLLSDLQLPLEITFSKFKQTDLNKLKIEYLHFNDLTEEDKKFEHSHYLGLDKPDDWIRFYKNDELKEVDWLGVDEFVHSRHIPYVPMNIGYKKELVKIYVENVQNSKSSRKNFIENIQIFIPDAEEILVSKIDEEDVLSISLVGKDENFPITNWGDGLIRMIRILLEISKCKNGRLMLDEATIGIHYSKLTSFWFKLLKTCLRNKVQLFATTHSYESLKAFCEAAKMYEDKNVVNDFKCIKLVNLEKENQTKSYTYSFEDFSVLLENNSELRG